MRRFTTPAASLLLVFTQAPAALDNPCDGNYVYVDGAGLVVEPTGSDDTDNIQCALNTAVAQGISSVKLNAGDFTMSSVSIEDFNGALSGVSKSNTSLTVVQGSIDCAGLEAEQKGAAALTFVEGSPRLQNMTVVAEPFCSAYGDLPPVLVSFTGQPTGTEECSNDVVFGVVDRVTFESEDPSVNAVIAAAQGYDLGGCKQTLLGTLKVNRSEFRGFSKAIGTAMRGGAQVDVNYNTFRENTQDVNFFNSNQSTNVIGNTFYGTPKEDDVGYLSVVVATRDADAPNQSKFVISGNTFDIDAPDSLQTAGVYLVQQSKVADLSVSIVSNTFRLSGDNTFGILEGGVNSGFIAKNSFRGDAYSAITLGQADTNPSSDWTIVANTGLGSFSSAEGDVLLGSQTKKAIVGPDQNAQIIDLGTGNTSLPVDAEVVEVTNAIISNVLGNFEGWDGDTVVELLNGQVWQQTEYYYYYWYGFQPRIVIYSEPSCFSGAKAVVPDSPAEGVCVERIR